jgi:hypothetical protein
MAPGPLLSLFTTTPTMSLHKDCPIFLQGYFGRGIWLVFHFYFFIFYFFGSVKKLREKKAGERTEQRWIEDHLAKAKW